MSAEGPIQPDRICPCSRRDPDRAATALAQARPDRTGGPRTRGEGLTPGLVHEAVAEPTAEAEIAAEAEARFVANMTVDPAS